MTSKASRQTGRGASWKPRHFGRCALQIAAVLNDNPLMQVWAERELCGREEELARLERFAGELPFGPRGIVIRGEAGIGKTSLWRIAVQAALASDFAVLSTRCVEGEMPLAFGGLADLLDAVPADVVAELPEPQQAALAVATGLEAPGDEPSDRITLPRAFASVLRALATRAPLLVAVDDAQWLDAASRRIVAFAARRLGDAPVGILVTQRGAEPDALDLLRTLEDRSDEIRVGPLSVGALHHLVRSRLGVRIPRPTLARVHEATGGNPMFALEFARGVADRGGSPGPLPLPSSLEELVRERVAGYPNEIRPLLEVVAAIPRPTPSLLARAVGGADVLLDAAVRAGAVTLGDDAIVRFSHPLLASAVYADLPPGLRRALHARVGALADDLEERARQFALASPEPDADVARLLAAAAARARSRGAPEAAAELAQQGVRLTPLADVGDREERALAVAEYLADSGQVAAATTSLDELLAGPLTGPRRARALLIRFQVEHDVEARGRTVEEALEYAGADRALRARVLLLASKYRINRQEIDTSEELARQALAEAEQADDPALLATALATVAARSYVAGRPEPVLLERAIAVGDVHGILPRTTPPRVLLAELRIAEGDLTGARELLIAELDAASSSGSEYERMLIDPAQIELDAGHWERAERYLDQAWELAFDGGDRFFEGWVYLRRASLAALRGRADDARQLARQGIAHAESAHWEALAAANRWMLGFLELSLGEPKRAWRLLADAAAEKSVVPRARGLFGRGAFADAVEALVALGRTEDARATLIRVETDGGENPWTTPAALRCRALLLLSEGESEPALAAAEASASGFEAIGFPFDRGRALLVAGEALRRLGQRRRAAEKLQAAKAIFAELGAALWLERAETELRRASPRPRRDRELTNAERRVAALVATGRTNREVAAQLFTTVATVEAHLTRIYRKAGVRSRTELARRIADGRLEIAEA